MPKVPKRKTKVRGDLRSPRCDPSNSSKRPDTLQTTDKRPDVSTSVDNTPRPGPSTDSKRDEPETDSDQKVEKMSPSTIRFSQDTISHKFTDRSFLDKTLSDLKIKEISVDEIPRIHVVEKDGIYFTNDNRRLCVFQKYEEYLGEKLMIPVNIVKDLHTKKCTTRNGGKSVDIKINGCDRKIETWTCQKK